MHNTHNLRLWIILPTLAGSLLMPEFIHAAPINGLVQDNIAGPVFLPGTGASVGGIFDLTSLFSAGPTSISSGTATFQFQDNSDLITHSTQYGSYAWVGSVMNSYTVWQTYPSYECDFWGCHTVYHQYPMTVSDQDELFARNVENIHTDPGESAMVSTVGQSGSGGSSAYYQSTPSGQSQVNYSWGSEPLPNATNQFQNLGFDRYFEVNTGNTGVWTLSFGLNAADLAALNGGGTLGFSVTSTTGSMVFTGASLAYAGETFESVILPPEPEAAVPEPSTFMAMGLGLASLAWFRRRKTAKTPA